MNIINGVSAQKLQLDIYNELECVHLSADEAASLCGQLVAMVVAPSSFNVRASYSRLLISTKSLGTSH